MKVITEEQKQELRHNVGCLVLIIQFIFYSILYLVLAFLSLWGLVALIKWFWVNS
jgi:hypothetical protein